MGDRRRYLLPSLIAAALLAAVLYFTSDAWMTSLARLLIYDQGPAKADIAVVLGGDQWGHRILKGAELVREGYVPAVLVSGPPGIYGFHESDLAIQFAVGKGFPAAWFIPFTHDALSTRDEAVAILKELRRRGVRCFLLVTSNFHTARATRLYRWAGKRVAGGPSFRTVASSDQFFTPDGWWRNREARKIFFFEWVKTLATAVGM